MAIIDDFFIKLGYDYDEKDLDKFNEIVETTGRGLKIVSLAAIGLTTSFAILFSNLSANALGQQRFGKAMGVSRAQIAAFQRTSEELTGERGTADRFLTQINDINNGLKAGKAPSEDFLIALGKLNIKLSEIKDSSPDQVLLRLAQEFQRVDEDSQDAVASLLSLDSAGRNLFQGLTRERLRSNIPSEADLEAIEKFDKLLKDVKQTFNDSIVVFGTPLFEKLIPAIEGLNSKLPQLIDLAGQATEAFLGLGTAIGEAFGFVSVEVEKVEGRLDKLIRENLHSTSTKDLFSKSVESLGNVVFPLFDNFIGFEKDLFSFVTGNGFGSSTSNSNSNVTINNNYKIDINTDNPQSMIGIIQRTNEESMSQAKKNLTSGSKN